MVGRCGRGVYQVLARGQIVKWIGNLSPGNRAGELEAGDGEVRERLGGRLRQSTAGPLSPLQEKADLGPSRDGRDRGLQAQGAAYIKK